MSTDTFFPTIEGDEPAVSTTLYVKLPGGAIGQRADGSGIHLKYGARVPVDDLNEATLARIDTFADTRFRGVDADPNAEQLAHARTAIANGGQVNSASSPVPANYGDLTEDDAAAFVRSLELTPESQASVIISETLFHGKRQKVLDSATEAARISADLQINAAGALQRQVAEAGGFLPPTPTPVGDAHAGTGDPAIAARVLQLQDAAAQAMVAPSPFGQGGDATPATPVEGSDDSSRTALADAARALSESQEQARRQAAALAQEQDASKAKDDEIAALKARVEELGLHGQGGDASTKLSPDEAPSDFSGFTYKQLQLYIDQHGLDISKNQSTAKLIEAISAVEGHGKPQTPPLPEDTDPATLRADAEPS